jgi:Tol biopolymer transport system component
VRRTTTRAVAAAATVLAIFAPASADAARSTGKIAYIKKLISVRAVSADGKIDKPFAPLRSGAQGPGPPLWSPDGRRLLFHRDDPHALVTVTPGKGRSKVLYEGQDEIGEAPAEYGWSPNGRLIALTHGVLSSDGFGPPAIPLLVMQADGSGKRELLGVNPSDINWLPDNRRISFIRSEGETAAMWSVDIVTGAQVKLFDVPLTDHNFSLSPDGRSLVFDRSVAGTVQLWVMRSNGTGARAVVKRPGAFASSGSWSPDGRELAFLVQKGRSGPSDIYKVRLDGSGPKRLTKHGKALAPHWGRGRLPKRGRVL